MDEDLTTFYGIDLDELKLFKDPMLCLKKKPDKKIITSPKAGNNRRAGQFDLGSDIAQILLEQ